MRLGTMFERSPREPQADEERALREARIAAARRQARWREVPDDLVRRGRCLVSAGSDEVYLPYGGVVFETGSAGLIADQAELVFTVSADGELRFLDRQPGKWSCSSTAPFATPPRLVSIRRPGRWGLELAPLGPTASSALTPERS